MTTANPELSTVLSAATGPREPFGFLVVHKPVAEPVDLHSVTSALADTGLTDVVPPLVPMTSAQALQYACRADNDYIYLVRPEDPNLLSAPKRVCLKVVKRGWRGVRTPGVYRLVRAQDTAEGTDDTTMASIRLSRRPREDGPDLVIRRRKSALAKLNESERYEITETFLLLRGDYRQARASISARAFDELMLALLATAGAIPLGSDGALFVPAAADELLDTIGQVADEACMYRPAPLIIATLHDQTDLRNLVAELAEQQLTDRIRSLHGELDSPSTALSPADDHAHLERELRGLTSALSFHAQLLPPEVYERLTDRVVGLEERLAEAAGSPSAECDPAAAAQTHHGRTPFGMTDHATPQPTEPVEDRIVKAIVDDLTARRGLRQEWDDMDERTQNEIQQTWKKIVADALAGPDDASPAAQT